MLVLGGGRLDQCTRRKNLPTRHHPRPPDLYLLYLFVSVGVCSYPPLPSPTRIFSGLENVH